MVEDADDDVGEGDAEVEHDVSEGIDEDAHRPVDEVHGDEVGLLCAEHARQQHHAARVVEDGPEHCLFEVAWRDLARCSQAPRRGEVRDERGVVVRQHEVDQEDFSGEPLAERRREVDGHGRAAGPALGRVDGDGGRRLLRRDHARAGDQVGQGVLALLDELGQLDDGVGVGGQGLVEGLAVEGEQPAVLERPDAGGPRLLGDERHLAEEVVRAHERDRDGVPGGLLDVHLAAPGLDHEHGVAGVALVDDHGPLGGRGRGQPAGEGVEDVVRQREEDGHTLQDLESLPKLVGAAPAELMGVAHAG